jgi:hypothetical protein
MARSSVASASSRPSAFILTPLHLAEERDRVGVAGPVGVRLEEQRPQDAAPAAAEAVPAAVAGVDGERWRAVVVAGQRAAADQPAAPARPQLDAEVAGGERRDVDHLGQAPCLGPHVGPAARPRRRFRPGAQPLPALDLLGRLDQLPGEVVEAGGDRPGRRSPARPGRAARRTPTAALGLGQELGGAPAAGTRTARRRAPAARPASVGASVFTGVPLPRPARGAGPGPGRGRTGAAAAGRGGPARGHPRRRGGRRAAASLRGRPSPPPIPPGASRAIAARTRAACRGGTGRRPFSHSHRVVGAIPRACATLLLADPRPHPQQLQPDPRRRALEQPHERASCLVPAGTTDSGR